MFEFSISSALVDAPAITGTAKSRTEVGEIIHRAIPEARASQDVTSPGLPLFGNVFNWDGDVVGSWKIAEVNDE